MAKKEVIVPANPFVKKVIVKLIGLQPGLLTDNGMLADPTSENAITLSKLKDQAKNSAEARKEYTKFQLLARSYFNENGEVIIPQNMLQTSFLAGVSKAGVKTKEIKKVQSGIAVFDNAVLYVNGAVATAEGLEENQYSAIVTNANAGGKSVIYRPHYKNWTADVPVEIETDLLDIDVLRNVINASGRFVGIGCWRPSSKKPGKHGRFQILEIIED